jgi:hypothetical protein
MNQAPKAANDRPAQLERCGSCNGVINQMTGECRCS